jgi:hypothetical protein
MLGTLPEDIIGVFGVPLMATDVTAVLDSKLSNRVYRLPSDTALG